jgi:glucose-1-phosphate cytidylyltransferase
MSEGGKRIDLHSSDIDDWRITFVDTGLHANIAERLVRARPFLDSEGTFLANYSDALSDVCLDTVLSSHRNATAVATLVAVPSWHSFHTVVADSDGVVQQLGEVRDSAFMVNGGFFVLEPSIFEFIEAGEELVEAPFRRLASRRSLHAYRHKGFWQQMDNLKDKITFDRMEARGDCPWMLWKR